MLKKMLVLLIILTLAVPFLPSFAINPGAVNAQMQNNMQEIQRNKERMKQQQMLQEKYKQQKAKKQYQDQY